MSAATDGAAPAAHPARGIAQMLLAMAIVTGTDVLSKALSPGYADIQIAWGRFFFHLVPLLAGLAAWRGPTGIAAAVATARPALQILRSFAFLGGNLAVITALGLLPLAEVVAILFLSPLILVILSALLLRERVAAVKWLAVLAGFAGVLLVAWPSGAGALNWGGLFAAVATLCFSVGHLLTRALRAEPPLVTLFYTAAIGAVALTLAMPFAWTMPDAAGWLLLVGSGLTLAVFHFVMIGAFRRAPASTLAPFHYTQLIWAVLAGWLIFAEPPEWRTLAGAAVIVGAGLLVWWRERGAAAPAG